MPAHARTIIVYLNLRRLLTEQILYKVHTGRNTYASQANELQTEIRKESECMYEEASQVKAELNSTTKWGVRVCGLPSLRA